MKLLLGKLVLILLSTVITLGLLELGLRFLGPPPASAPFVPDAVLHHVKMRDFAFRSYNPDDQFAPFIIYWDARGLVADPEKKFIFDPLRHIHKIAVVGDSFVEASQVPYANSFTGLLNKYSQPDVFFFNWGIASCSPVIYVPLWRTRILETHPEHVFLLLYENDVSEDEYFAKMAVFDGKGLPLRVTAPPEPAILNWVRRSSLFRFLRFAFIKTLAGIHPKSDPTASNAGEFLELSPDISPFTERMILGLRKEIEESGSKLTVIAVPSRRADLFGDPSDGHVSFATKVAAWCHGHDIDYIDLEKSFQEWRKTNGNAKLFFKKDIHWTSAAHRLAAEAIMSRYPEYFLATRRGGIVR